MDPDVRGVFVAHDLGSTWVFMHDWDPGVESFDDYTPERCARLFRAAAGVDDLGAHHRARPALAHDEPDRRALPRRPGLPGGRRGPPLPAHRGPRPQHRRGRRPQPGLEAGGRRARVGATCAARHLRARERRPVASDERRQEPRERRRACSTSSLACGATGTATESRAAFDAAVATEEGRAAIAAAVEGQDEHFDMLGLQLGFTYGAGSGPVLDDGTPPVEVANPVRDVRAHHPTGWPAAPCLGDQGRATGVDPRPGRARPLAAG